MSIPVDLLAAADKLVQEGYVRSRNDLLAAALRRELAARRRQAIDAAFAGMSRDPAYQAEAEQIAEEFAKSDWQALQEAEEERP